VKPETGNRKCETGELGAGKLACFPFLISGFLFLIPFGRGSDEQKQLTTMDYGLSTGPVFSG
jgi:hypothetical protein